MNLQAMLSSPQGTVVGSSFNQLLQGFLSDLKETFPEREELDLAMRALAVASETDPMSSLNGWLKSMQVLKAAGYEQPFFSECTEAKINAFLSNLDKMHPLLRLLPLEAMWNDPGLLDEDRQAIWDHLQQLELSSMTINAFDPKAIAAIENLAKRYMTQLQSTDPSQLDVKMLGFDVIRQVMKDEDIKKALADPSAESRFAATFGKDGEKFAQLAGGSTAGAGLSGMLGSLGAGLGTGEQSGAELLRGFSQMMGAAAVATDAGAGAAGAPADLGQLPPAVLTMMQQMGVDPQMAAQFMQDARFQ